MASQRVRVMTLYRTLLHLGKDFPQVHICMTFLRYMVLDLPYVQGYTYFRDRCHGAFLRNKDLPPKQVRNADGTDELETVICVEKVS